MQIFDTVQGTPEWLEIRKATITGSRVKALKAMPIDEPKIAKIDWNSAKDRTPAYVALMNEMIAEDLAPLPETFINAAMERGNLLEPEARHEYERVTGQEVIEIGFCKHDTRNYLGLSSDGFVKPKKAGDYTKSIEIKCPGPKNHIKTIKSNQIPEQYIPQIVHNFLVCETLEEMDFVSFNPDMYLKRLRIHIINIKRSDLEKEIEETKVKLDAFAKVWEESINTLTKEVDENKKTDTKENSKKAKKA